MSKHIFKNISISFSSAYINYGRTAMIVMYRKRKSSKNMKCFFFVLELVYHIAHEFFIHIFIFILNMWPWEGNCVHCSFGSVYRVFWKYLRGGCLYKNNRTRKIEGLFKVQFKVHSVYFKLAFVHFGIRFEY